MPFFAKRQSTFKQMLYFLSAKTLLLILAIAACVSSKSNSQCSTITLPTVSGFEDSTFVLLDRTPSDTIPCLPRQLPVDQICGYFNIPNGFASVHVYGLPVGNLASVQLFEGPTCDKLAFEIYDTLDITGLYLTANFVNNSIRVCADTGSATFARVIPLQFVVPIRIPYLDIDTLCPPMSADNPMTRDPRMPKPGPWIDMHGRIYNTQPPTNVLLYDRGRRKKVYLLSY